MGHLALTVLGLIVVAMLVPTAQATDEAADCRTAIEAAGAKTGSNACVVAFAHIHDWWASSLVNTQRPPLDGPVREDGSNHPTFTPLYDLNRFTFNLEQGPVFYDRSGVSSYTQRWFGDLPLVEGVPMQARLHFTVDQLKTPASDPPVGAGVHPCVTVALQLKVARTGTDAVEVLSEAQVTGHLVRPAASVPTLDCADEDRFAIDPAGVTTFDIRLPGPRRPIEPIERPFLEARLFTLHHEDDEIAFQGARIVQDAAHLNHIVLPMRDAITIDDVTTDLVEGFLAIGTNITTPWGQYDVDPARIQVGIHDHDGTVVFNLTRDLTVRQDLSHDGTRQPLHALVGLDLRGADLQDGRYTVRVTAANAQNSARAEATEAFLITDGGANLILYSENGTVATEHRLREPAETPASFPLALLAVMACVALLRRRLM